MTPRAVIAEDEPALADALREALAQAWPELRVVAIAPDGEQALAAIADHRPDVVFLDVRMPVLDGIGVARRLVDPPAAPMPMLVFVTAFDQYALEAFDAAAVDYLLKPVGAERLARCVARLRGRLDHRSPPDGGADPRIAVLETMLARLAAAGAGGDGSAAAQGPLRFVRASIGDTVRQIAVADVLWFEARDKYVAVMTADGESLIRVPLAEIESRLDPARFARIHRSRIVNLDEIESIRRDFAGRSVVHLRTPVQGREIRLEVSRAYAANFRAM